MKFIKFKIFCISIIMLCLSLSTARKHKRASKLQRSKALVDACTKIASKFSSFVTYLNNNKLNSVNIISSMGSDTDVCPDGTDQWEFKISVNEVVDQGASMGPHCTDKGNNKYEGIFKGFSLSGTNDKKKLTFSFKMECDDWGSDTNANFSGDFTITLTPPTITLQTTNNADSYELSFPTLEITGGTNNYSDDDDNSYSSNYYNWYNSNKEKIQNKYKDWVTSSWNSFK
jgi:hypothetical protein